MNPTIKHGHLRLNGNEVKLLIGSPPTNGMVGAVARRERPSSAGFVFLLNHCGKAERERLVRYDMVSFVYSKFDAYYLEQISFGSVP